jgi:serine/threonine-protein kinase RsbW
MKYKRKVPCTKEQLKEIRGFVNDSLGQHGLSDVDISAMVLAIDEVCANLIIHSHHCNPKEHIEIIINVGIREGVEFRIVDEGVGFDINQYEEPTIDDLIKSKRKGGIGLILVKKIMDDIDFIKIQNKNTCRLFKKINIS